MNFFAISGRALVASFLAASAIARTQAGSWQRGFDVTEIDGAIRALVSVDLGSGPELYAGGDFTTIDGRAMNHVARFDGLKWNALDLGVDGAVQALAVFDDGSGAALYATGSFLHAGSLGASHIAKWNGASWSALGSGLDDDGEALCVGNFGAASSLCVGGKFASAGGQPIAAIAKWNGSQWSGFSAALAGDAHALAVFDDGAGAELYAGGAFQASGHYVGSVVRWNGVAWNRLGVTGSVKAMVVHDDGSGPALYLGGNFYVPNDGQSHAAAKWRASTWMALAGLPTQEVDALASWNGPHGRELYAGGNVSVNDPATGEQCYGIVRWNGASWNAVGRGADTWSTPAPSSLPIVYALALHDDGGGVKLFAGGAMESLGGAAAPRLASWDGFEWSRLSRGGGATRPVNALAVHDDGLGSALYVAGDFAAVGERGARNARRIARRAGGAWKPLADGVKLEVHAVTSFDAGTGAAQLFIGTDASSGVLRWDGAAWSVPGSGLSGVGTLGALAFASFDDGLGSGPRLVAGGQFRNAGPTTQVASIALFDGVNWLPLGSGVTGPNGALGSGIVRALASFDDGTGPALYVGGDFAFAGGLAASNLAKWDGTQWQALSTGANGTVRALTVWRDSAHPSGELVIGGDFSAIGGVAAPRIASFDGLTFHAFGAGADAPVRVLDVERVAQHQQLFVGGDFTAIGGVSAAHVATFDGTHWRALDRGTDGPVFAIAQFDEGDGPALFVGGDFTRAGDRPSGNLAKFRFDAP